MYHILQQKIEDEILGVIYNIQKYTRVSPNTSKFVIVFKKETWEVAFNFPPLCHIFGLPHKVPIPKIPKLISFL